MLFGLGLLRPSKYRRALRWIILTMAFLSIAAGYAALIIPPDTPTADAFSRGFWGIVLLLLGLMLALLSGLLGS
ncbi:MAG: hypothetical protein EYX74_00690 [Desulfobulbaceae bacterium]|nr:MAG: hypothetical protein EYX74_00690 [Desulfobulbaceae bacterium]